MTKPAKQPRKVALIHVLDYPREDYSAYWNISVLGDDEEGYRWEAKLMSYDPVGWDYKGKVTEKRPDVPWPTYPGDVRVTQAQYVKMPPEEQAAVRRQQELRRLESAEIYEAHPKPVYLLDEEMGTTDTRDEADTAAQQWVKARIGKLKRPPKAKEDKEAGYAAVGLISGWFILEGIAEMLRRLLLGPMLAIAYNVLLRNSRLNAVRDAIDAGAGAGLLRIYDGSRPATCGTATTLGAELTFSDPCAAAAGSGVLTASAITADASANASITATWFRAVDSTGTCVMDGNVGTSGSDMNLNTTTIAAGVQVACTSYTITGGNA